MIDLRAAGRTPDEQLAGLKAVAEKAGKAVCNAIIQTAGSDVAFLIAADVESPSEIVYADPRANYDVWHRGHLIRTNITADEAAAVVIAEYKEAKIARVMQRLCGRGWKNKRYRDTLAKVTAEVMDNKHERERSNYAADVVIKGHSVS